MTTPAEPFLAKVTYAMAGGYFRLSSLDNRVFFLLPGSLPEGTKVGDWVFLAYRPQQSRSDYVGLRIADADDIAGPLAEASTRYVEDRDSE